MLVNGFQIKEAMRKWQVEKDVAAQQFGDSLYVFENEAKTSPASVSKTFEEADRRLAELEALQQAYNAYVKVDVKTQDGREETISLALAVKLIGGAGRLEKMWKDATFEKKDRYDSFRDKTRSKDSEYAKRTIPMDQALEKAKQMAQYAASLRAAIAQGNMSNIDLNEEPFVEFGLIGLFD